MVAMSDDMTTAPPPPGAPTDAGTEAGTDADLDAGTGGVGTVVTTGEPAGAPVPAGPSRRVRQEWALCAIAAASGRFVPVPFVDDLVVARATRTAVARTFAAHGRTAPARALGVLAEDSETFWEWVRKGAAGLPLKLLLFPVRKIVRIVTAVHGVAHDVLAVWLLVRSVDRCLRAGWFATADPAEAEAQARLVRLAHETTVDGADLRVVQSLTDTALGQVRGLATQAGDYARRVYGATSLPGARAVRTTAAGGPGGTGPEGERAGGDLDGADVAPQDVATGAGAHEQAVAEGADRLVEALAGPEATSFFADFDRRFDETLRGLGG